MKEKIYKFTRSIPKGKVATYGQIAEYLGNKNLERVVGNILHNNPNPTSIPCHRVVNSKGRVSPAFAFGGGEAQQALLEKEGIVFETKGQVNLEKYITGV